MNQFFEFAKGMWPTVIGICGSLAALANFWYNVEKAFNARFERQKLIKEIEALGAKKGQIILPDLRNLTEIAERARAADRSSTILPLAMFFAFSLLSAVTYFQSSELARQRSWPQELSESGRRLADAETRIQNLTLERDNLKGARDTLQRRVEHLERTLAEVQRPSAELAEENERLKERLKLVTERLNQLRTLLEDGKK